MHPDFSRISVIGLGYIGLPTAAMFASRKIGVIGIDINAETVATINRGEIHIVEPDLDLAVRTAVQAGYLRASQKAEPAQAFLIAVPTPFQDEHQPDLSYIEAAARTIAPVLQPGNLIVLESTSPVGATEHLAGLLASERPDLTFPATHGESSDIRVAHCPERVLPGKVMQELVHNNRIIGGLTPRCSAMAEALYKTFVQGECVTTDVRTAEMAKLAENSFRDVNIGFANELSIICDRLDIDVWELIALANRHPRVNILSPGPGVGGHCIAVDPWFIITRSPDEARLIRTAREVNDSKPQWVIDKVIAALANLCAANPTRVASEFVIACYGLAFKPDIDDLRESPALEIARQLESIHDGPLLLVEPHVNHVPNGFLKAELVDIDWAYAEADLHLMLVDHTLFRQRGAPSGVIIDTKGIW
jgi:UDP-N-acetyl-D-mannosaminuronic acid dehydrogenase